MKWNNAQEYALYCSVAFTIKHALTVCFVDSHLQYFCGFVVRCRWLHYFIVFLENLLKNTT